MYRYFVSYYSTDFPRNILNRVVEMNNLIESHDDILELKAMVMKNNHVSDVSIINFILIKVLGK